MTLFPNMITSTGLGRGKKWAGFGGGRHSVHTGKESGHGWKPGGICWIPLGLRAMVRLVHRRCQVWFHCAWTTLHGHSCDRRNGCPLGLCLSLLTSVYLLSCLLVKPTPTLLQGPGRWLSPEGMSCNCESLNQSFAFGNKIRTVV